MRGAGGRFCQSSDKYDPGRLDFDVRLLRQFYLARGYADITVERAQGGLLPDRTGFAVTFAINEGPRYKLRDISLLLKLTILIWSLFVMRCRLTVRTGMTHG